MATGDSDDILTRLKAVLPLRWFGDSTTLVDGVLGGFAAVGAAAYTLLAYIKAQARIATATDGFLDLAAFDFFGLRIKRKPSQTDASMRAKIKAEVLRERVSRPGVTNALVDLTHNPVSMFEAFNPQDTGGWGVEFAFDAFGAWGSPNWPFTIFLNVVSPQGAGIANVSGFNSPQSGWGAGMFYFADLRLVQGEVTDQDIYDTVEQTRAAGIKSWVAIGPAPIVGGRLDIDFFLDNTPLA